MCYFHLGAHTAYPQADTVAHAGCFANDKIESNFKREGCNPENGLWNAHKHSMGFDIELSSKHVV